MGGAEGQLTHLALDLHRQGWDVRVAALLGDGPHAVTLENAGIEIYRGRLRNPSKARIVDALLLPFRFVRYVRWLRRVRPALVHAFLYHAYITTAFAATVARVPVVITARRSEGFFKAHHRPALFLERFANRYTDLVVANSAAVADDVRANEHLAAEKLVVIHNGVADEFFAVPEPTTTPGEPVVLCVANFIDYKGHRDLLDAAALLVGNGLRFVLRLVGVGPERPALERTVTEGALPVEFLGQRSDVEAQLAAADLFVLPSHQEGFSNSLLEAMAAGRAIVATDVGGNPEMLGDTGVLVPAHDPTALRDALGALLVDEPRRRQLGRAARERARVHFSLAAMIEAHVNLYTKVVSV